MYPAYNPHLTMKVTALVEPPMMEQHGNFEEWECRTSWLDECGETDDDDDEDE